MSADPTPPQRRHHVSLIVADIARTDAYLSLSESEGRDS